MAVFCSVWFEWKLNNFRRQITMTEACAMTVWCLEYRLFLDLFRVSRNVFKFSSKENNWKYTWKESEGNEYSSWNALKIQPTSFRFMWYFCISHRVLSLHLTLFRFTLWIAKKKNIKSVRCTNSILCQAKYESLQLFIFFCSFVWTLMNNNRKKKYE